MRRSPPRVSWLLGLGLVAWAAAPAPAVEDAALARVPPWIPPSTESCQPSEGVRGPQPGDAPPVPFEPGSSFALEQLDVLRNFLPEALWTHRDRFFHEGMRMEIGACFADYGPPEFFDGATQEFAGRAKLGDDGSISDYVAGTPFPPESIAVDDPLAGLKWAWNLELRYQGAGFRGRFRTSDMVGHGGRAEPFVGEIFKTQLAFRADRRKDDFVAPGSRNKHWVAGGQLFAPFDAREYSWRQYRDVEHLTSGRRTDDLHAYLPDYRRVRRVNASGVEGIYMPSFNVGVVKPGVLAGIGGGTDGVGAGGGGAAAGAAAASITTKRSGFEGLEIRPLLYEYSVVGVRDLLTPINATQPAFPEREDREFGAWGLSFASDTWDLRRAVVIEGRFKGESGGTQVNRLLLYIDAQTHYPIFYESFDARGEVIDVGMFVGRWSETRPDYPPWPDDPKRPVRVIDPVGASFANVSEGGGWRRESWSVVSTPLSDRKLKRQLSVSNLTRRR